jgi:DNA mismatch repair protein MutL
MPDNLIGIEPEVLLIDLLEHAQEHAKWIPQEVYDKVATMACKAAIKGNQKVSMQEAKSLFAQLLQLENPYTCPHGRPTMIRMTQYELEKKFKRVL